MVVKAGKEFFFSLSLSLLDFEVRKRACAESDTDL